MEGLNSAYRMFGKTEEWMKTCILDGRVGEGVKTNLNNGWRSLRLTAAARE